MTTLMPERAGRLERRRQIEAARVTAVERNRDTPGLQMARREAAERDVAYHHRQMRRAS